jgi:NodT family efflux transporter outer membrane factor (OMF) lipoprotein
VCLALSACVSVGPEDALAPAAVPADWAALSGELGGAGATPVTEDWLAELSDPTVTPLVAEALAYNNDLAAAAARVRAQLAQARITRSQLFPQVQVGGTALRVRPSGIGGIVGGQPIQGGQYFNQYSLELGATWQLDVWGRLADQTRAAYRTYEAATLDYAAASLSLSGNTAQAFYALTEARLQKELAERDVAAGLANLNIIERRYERGVSSSLDVRLARASLAQSEAQLVAREQAEQEAARQVEFLLGRYPAAEVAAADTLPELRAFVSEDGDVIGVGDPKGLLFRRPDVLAAEGRLVAAGLEVQAARKALLPSFSINAALTGETTDAAGPIVEPDFSQLTDPDALGKRLVGQIVQPIFQGGRLRANVKAARSRMEAAVYDYAQVALNAYRDVENALAAEAFLASQQEARRLAFEEARAAEELTERQYLNGTTNVFDLISAQQRAILNEGQFIAASRARLANRIDLYLALGAPFTVPTPDSLGGRPGGGLRFTPPERDEDIAVRAAEERQL